MKKSSNLNSVLEIFWLIMAIFTLLLGLYIWFTNEFRAAGPFFIMAALSAFLFLARRGIRLKNKDK